MKKITLVLDGSADRPNAALGNKTPLEYAKTPALDGLFQKSTGGTVLTIPKGLEVGSAVANLSLLGFDPVSYTHLFSPLDAQKLGIGIVHQEISLCPQI